MEEEGRMKKEEIDSMLFHVSSFDRRKLFTKTHVYIAAPHPRSTHLSNTQDGETTHHEEGNRHWRGCRWDSDGREVGLCRVRCACV
jgi:hypothetical protein